MKKNERLMEQLGEVDDRFITESAPSNGKSGKNPVKWTVIGAMGAAAAVIVLWQGAKIIHYGKGDKISSESSKTYGQRIEFPEISGELPLISTSGFGSGGGMGFEGFMTYDVSTLLDGNPSRENCQFTELPVFSRSEQDRDVYSIEEMDEKLKGIAEQLTDEEYVSSYDGYGLSATAGDINLKMTAGEIRIEFKNAVDLPDEFGIYPEKNDDTEQITSSLEYLGEKYGSILGLYAPVPSVFVDYDIYDNPCARYCCLYDDSDDPLTALMNYSFRNLNFFGEEIQIDDNPDKYANPYDAYECTGDLTDISYSDQFTSLEFMGMYPVIGYEQAYEELLDGNYHTTVWEEAYLPDGIVPEEVTFTGITYKITEDYKYQMPYYRFLIELHAERTADKYAPGNYALNEGMKEYGAFYVMAVSPDYLIIENTDFAYN